MRFVFNYFNIYLQKIIKIIKKAYGNNCKSNRNASNIYLLYE